METVVAENEAMLIIQDEWSEGLDEYAKKRLGAEFSVFTAFSKKENRVVAFVLYWEGEAIREDTSIEGMASKIDLIYMIKKSQEWVD